MNWGKWSLAAIAAVCMMGPAFAHHSFAMFDHDHQMTLTGTVKEFDWANPHTWLHIMVEGKNGKAAEWSLELQGTGQSTRTGWSHDSVKPGDKVTVLINPLKTGARGGQLVEATLPDGPELGGRGHSNNPYGK